MQTEQITNSGSGFLGALTLIFITLKLTDNIDWSWLWVLSPIWIPAAVGLALCVALLIAAVMIEFINRWDR